jgi:U3 small nucleolar RNA-associated protein 18
MTFSRWDLRTKKCIRKFSNEDGTISSTLSMSSNYVAVGSESGVVNLYDNASLEGRSYSERTPVKQIMNIKTSVDFMKFNTNGEILAMSTRREKDSLKLLHTKSKTVFSNWPTTKTPLGYVWSLELSPGSRFMAIGNDTGKCLLTEQAESLP